MNKLLQIASAVETATCCSFETLLENPEFEALARKVYRENASIEEAAVELINLASKLI